MNNSTKSAPRHWGKTSRQHYGRKYPARPKRSGAYINPDRFINKATTPEQEEIFVPKHSFADFRFEPTLHKNLARQGYDQPTPIQDGAIRPILEGQDLVGQANTGTGKTAAFILPLIQRLVEQKIHRVLIVAPTRELAVQIEDEFKKFAANMRIYSALCIGGTNMGRQIHALSRRPQVVIGTPGRLIDLFKQHVLRLDNIDALVLDEVDRMLDMGFVQDIRFLVSQLAAEHQTACFSATVTPTIKALLDDMLHSPISVSVRTRDTGEHIEQDVISAHTKEEKIEKLQELLQRPDFDKVLIFGQTKFGVQRLADSISKSGISAAAIHGNKSQTQRQQALRAFKDGKVTALVATDVAARGLDIPQVSHVINFDQPSTYEDYIHRIGRTGRAGQTGHALTFVS